MADTALDTNQYPSMLFGTAPGQSGPPPPPPEPVPEPQAQGDRPPPPAVDQRAFEPGWMPGQQQAPSTPGVNQQQGPSKFDEEQEEQIRSKNEEADYGRQLLDHETGKPLVAPNLLQLDDYQKSQIEELRTIAKQFPDRRSFEHYTKLANDMQNKLQSKIDHQNAQLQREFVAQKTAQVRSSKFPNRTPEQRGADAQVLDGAYDSVYGTMIKSDLSSSDPETKRNGEYFKTITPFSTMSTPKPGEDPAVAEARNRTAFIAMADRTALINPKLSSEEVVTALMGIGSPVDTRNDPAARGHNQLRGKGGTNYKVLPGHDAGDNWILQLPGGQNIRIDDKDKRTLDRARQVGFAQGKKWMADQATQKAQSEQPNFFERNIFAPIFGPRVPTPARP